MTDISKELDPKALEAAWREASIALRDHVGNDMGPIQRTALMQVVVAAAIPAYLSQSLRSGNGGEVRVKALEWSSTIEGAEFAGGLYSEAQSPLGVYMAWGSGMWRGPSSGASKHVGDIATAKAAAQADYETRIRSALDIKP